ncbi:hypothetical protein [Streptomyces sp. NRRL F-525]|uniref:hypothetical protein n=1 Tax=Streptomyces sp. NRRL F-525 TaxID=1463861 RepID=UPI00131B3284|nr:hypothetical protein [Streptomyces sp. NRRL F-525]
MNLLLGNFGIPARMPEFPECRRDRRSLMGNSPCLAASSAPKSTLEVFGVHASRIQHAQHFDVLAGIPW